MANTGKEDKMKITIKLMVSAVFLLCVGFGSVAAQEKTVVGGSGAMGGSVEILAKAYKQKHSSDALDVILEPMSTTGGIEGLKAGRLTIGLITRSLTEDEKKEGLTYRPLTWIPVVVGLHKSLPVANLSDAQVCDVFNGKIKSWKEVGGSEGKITVLGRKKDDNGMETFREKMACFKNLQLSPETVFLVRGSEVLDSINNRPGTVGITVAGSVMLERPNIKAVAVNGIAPTMDAVKTGKYKYFNEVGVVTIGEPKGTAKRFVEFASSLEGDKILEKFGMTVAR
jgi:phosphate transport system substrate-binding protein